MSITILSQISTILIWCIMNNNNFYESVRPYEQDFGIGLNSFEKLTTMRPHWHEHIEFVYITRGDGVL